MEQFDCIIIGGGIVGLSVGWALLESNRKIRVAVLEKEDDWGRHQSGRNSGVIHSGIYYKPGSLKAKLCREGNRRIVELCDLHGIPYEVCGKLIVATMTSELPRLNNLYEREIANGLEVKKLSAPEVREIEPHVSCLAGILVPSTGIVDFAAVCRRLAELIRSRGGSLWLNTKVERLRTDSSEGVLETSKGALAARWIINCAGLQSDRLAKLAGAEPAARIVPFRGEYYELKAECRYLVRNLIYPVPDPQFPFFGVHFTRMADGTVHAGPNAVLSLKREGYSRDIFQFQRFPRDDDLPRLLAPGCETRKSGIEEMHRSFNKRAFLSSLQKLILEIRAELLLKHFKTQSGKHWFISHTFEAMHRIRGSSVPRPPVTLRPSIGGSHDRAVSRCTAAFTADSACC